MRFRSQRNIDPIVRNKLNEMAQQRVARNKHRVISGSVLSERLSILVAVENREAREQIKSALAAYGISPTVTDDPRSIRGFAARSWYDRLILASHSPKYKTSYKNLIPEWIGEHPSSRVILLVDALDTDPNQTRRRGLAYGAGILEAEKISELPSIIAGLVQYGFPKTDRTPEKPKQGRQMTRTVGKSYKLG